MTKPSTCLARRCRRDRRHCPNWTCPPRLHQAVAEDQAVDNLLAVAVSPGSARFPTGCAQRHELSNRLYTLSGLLQLGRNGEAVDYVQPLTETSSTRPSAVADAVSDPYLQALLVAKTEQAQE